MSKDLHDKNNDMASSLLQYEALANELLSALERIMPYALTGASVHDVFTSEQPQFVKAYSAIEKARRVLNDE